MTPWVRKWWKTEKGSQPGYVLRDRSRGGLLLLGIEDCYSWGGGGKVCSGTSHLIIRLLYVACTGTRADCLQLLSQMTTEKNQVFNLLQTYGSST